MKSLFEQIGGTYHEENGYFIPNLTLPIESEQSIGIWGQRHLIYIKQHHKVRYTNLLTSGKLNGYLANVDRQAEEMFFQLVKEFAENERVTESLKVTDQMAWVGAMNNIRARTLEIINLKVIFV